MISVLKTYLSKVKLQRDKFHLYFVNRLSKHASTILTKLNSKLKCLKIALAACVKFHRKKIKNNFHFTGLIIASSKISGLLVAPMKKTLFFDETPSISVNS